MDYFQGVVTEFLRRDRAVFVNPECLIQLDETGAAKGRHWYCDVLAVNFRLKCVFLCEVTYSTTLQSLLARLRAWDANWAEICGSIYRDCGVPSTWKVQPWVFIPESYRNLYCERLPKFVPKRETQGQMPFPRMTLLEKVAPWRYPEDRKDDYLEPLLE